MKRSLFSRLACLLLVVLLCAVPICVQAAEDEADPIARFSDLSPTAWYTEPVREAVGLGLFSGVSATAFGPNAPMTRAMLITAVWRLAGSPASDAPIPFQDVAPSAYYADAVRWAAANGVVSGVSADRFAPSGIVTRQQTAVILLACARKLEAAPQEASAPLGGFPDGDRVSAWAADAVRWALGRNLMSGAASGGLLYLYPRKEATRAEAAALLVRFRRLTLLGEEFPAQAPQQAEAPTGSYGLWVEGTKLTEGPVWNGTTYCRLSELAELGGGSLEQFGNLCLEAWQHRVWLSLSSKTALAGGSRSTLTAPCLYYRGEWYAPANEVLALLGMDRLDDEELQQSIFSYVPHNDAIAAGKHIVILRYHCVSDDVWGSEPLFMSPSSLEEQLRAMEKLGCSFLSFEDLDKIDQYERPVFLTFDDGYRDNYSELYPILKRHNAKATIFVITAGIGNTRQMPAEQLRELSESGLVSIQSHTVNHKDMRQMTEQELNFQCGYSQLTLARITGKIPFVMSFPRAMANDEAFAAVARYYQFSVIRDGEQYVTGTDPYHIPRFVMPRSLTLEKFLTYFD